MILNVPRRENSNRRPDEGGYALMQSRLNKAYALAHPRRARGCPAGHRGRMAQGVRHTRRGEGAPHRPPPEAVEGVAVGCAVARRWLWILWRSALVAGVSVAAVDA